MNDKNTFYLPRQTPYFCLKRLKIKDLRDLERDLYPCCTPILKILLTGLPSIKTNMTCGEKSFRSILKGSVYDERGLLVF